MTQTNGHFVSYSVSPLVDKRFDIGSALHAETQMQRDSKLAGKFKEGTGTLEEQLQRIDEENAKRAEAISREKLEKGNIGRQSGLIIIALSALAGLGWLLKKARDRNASS